MYLIDTNIWSHLLRQRSAALLERVESVAADAMCLSPIVRGELELGLAKGDGHPARRAALDALLAGAQRLAISQDVAVRYAQLRAWLEAQGTPIGPNDTWIAAEALHHGLILVTDNGREFERVPGLLIENWLEA